MSLKNTLKKAKQLDSMTQASVIESSDAKNSLSEDNLISISLSRQAVKPRNYLALNPLLQKGGIHDKEDVDIIRKKRRRETKQKLRKTDWLNEI